MSRRRVSETPDDRDERLRREALRALDKSHAAEDAIDAMVKRSITRYGP